MKNGKETFFYVLSIICCIILFILALTGLLLGVSSINAEGLGQIGVIFILPSIVAMGLIAVDFLITIEKIKNALAYSVFMSVFKVCLILLLLPGVVNEFAEDYRYGGSSELNGLLLLLGLFIVIIVPSLYNAHHLFYLKAEETKKKSTKKKTTTKKNTKKKSSK